MNSKFRNILSGGLLAVLAGLLPHETLGCGPFFQPHYFNGRSPYLKVFRGKAAIRRLITDLDDLIPAYPPAADGVSTREAEKIDFTAALDRYLPKLPPGRKEQLIGAYMKYIKDGGDFPKLPEELAEFRLYRMGVEEMHRNHEAIPPSWLKLLALPEKSRHYRTAWVHYMLGNFCWNDKKLRSESRRHYQDCRAAVRSGFADTAGLVKGSYRREFLLEKDPVRKIHIGLEAQRNCPKLELLAEEYLVIYAFKDVFSEPDCERMLADPVCRELLAVFGCKRKVFLRDVWKYKFRNADILAWRAYESGDVETAEKYLKLRTRDTLLSTYIEALIARYNGDNDLAIRKLRQWLDFASKIDPRDRNDVVAYKQLSHEAGDPFDTEQSYPLDKDVYGLLGSAMVLRKDFAEAAAFFYRAGQTESDVPRLAEQFMTLAELVAFTESIAADLNSKDEEKRRSAGMIRHMTARRAFREGKFDIARKYLPGKYKEILEQYLAFIRESKDISKSGDEKALLLFNAAKIMRWYGMELCGTQGLPDDFPSGEWGISADFEDCPYCKYDPKTDQWTNICMKHRELYSSINSSEMFYQEGERQPVPRNQRFHYRYRAAVLARQAADLAQDEDLRALANLFGGECLRIRTPRKADVFYKRLVRTSPNSALAQIADKLRWFPNCPALKNEFRSIEPCKTLDEVKAIMQQAVLEMNEIMKKKAEVQRNSAVSAEKNEQQEWKDALLQYVTEEKQK